MWRDILMIGAAIAIVLGSGALGQRAATAQSFDDELSRSTHTCVPLGWKPVATSDGAFVPGMSVEYTPNGWWLKPMWVGRIPDRLRINPDAHEISIELDELVKRGILARVTVPHATQYNLTLAAWHYEFDQNFQGSNPLHLTYLCYSGGAAWAAHDPIISAHSVILAPARNHLIDREAWR